MHLVLLSFDKIVDLRLRDGAVEFLVDEWK